MVVRRGTALVAVSRPEPCAGVDKARPSDLRGCARAWKVGGTYAGRYLLLLVREMPSRSY